MCILIITQTKDLINVRLGLETSPCKILYVFICGCVYLPNHIVLSSVGISIYYDFITDIQLLTQTIT